MGGIFLMSFLQCLGIPYFGADIPLENFGVHYSALGTRACASQAHVAVVIEVIQADDIAAFIQQTL